MKRLSIGIDAHKVTNVIGLAFNDMKEPQLYGKVFRRSEPYGRCHPEDPEKVRIEKGGGHHLL